MPTENDFFTSPNGDSPSNDSAGSSSSGGSASSSSSDNSVNSFNGSESNSSGALSSWSNRSSPGLQHRIDDSNGGWEKIYFQDEAEVISAYFKDEAKKAGARFEDETVVATIINFEENAMSTHFESSTEVSESGANAGMYDDRLKAELSSFFDEAYKNFEPVDGVSYDALSNIFSFSTVSLPILPLLEKDELLEPRRHVPVKNASVKRTDASSVEKGNSSGSGWKTIFGKNLTAKKVEEKKGKKVETIWRRPTAYVHGVTDKHGRRICRQVKSA